MKQHDLPIPDWDETFRARIRQAGDVLTPHLDEILEEFYDWLMSEGPGARFLTSEQVVRLKALQKVYWQDFFGTTVDAAYVASQQRVGEVHAQIGLPTNVYRLTITQME